MSDTDPMMNPAPIMERADTRDKLLNNLRMIIQWVSNRDHGTAVSLDEIVHLLEVSALEQGRLECKAELAALRRERDAARMDLHRIGEIIANPLILIEPDSEALAQAMDAAKNAKAAEQPITQPNV